MVWEMGVTAWHPMTVAITQHNSNPFLLDQTVTQIGLHAKPNKPSEPTTYITIQTPFFWATHYSFSKQIIFWANMKNIYGLYLQIIFLGYKDWFWVGIILGLNSFNMPTLFRSEELQDSNYFRTSDWKTKKNFWGWTVTWDKWTVHNKFFFGFHNIFFFHVIAWFFGFWRLHSRQWGVFIDFFQLSTFLYLTDYFTITFFWRLMTRWGGSFTFMRRLDFDSELGFVDESTLILISGLQFVSWGFGGPL